MLVLGLLAPMSLRPQAAAPAVLDEFSPQERQRILAHGPWPQPLRPDPGNRFSGLPQAEALGRQLFADTRLSGDGKRACISCHDPAQGFTDGRTLAQGAQALERNTQGLHDLSLQRWFGWDGGSDSLWAASLRPLLDAREMGSSPTRIGAVLRTDPALAKDLERVRAVAPAKEATPGADPADPADPAYAEIVDIAKLIAAWMRTLASPRTPFDAFRDAMAQGDGAAAARYPADARRGLKLFLGRGNCGLCHTGPNFSNGEFHDVGIPFFTGPGRVDPGRHRGVQRVLSDPFNLLGAHADRLPGDTEAIKTRTLLPAQHRHFGEWRTPSLRGLTATAPYMHNGRLPTLEAVVNHYDALDVERLHADGEALLRPLRLSAQERADLLAFLRSLSP